MQLEKFKSAKDLENVYDDNSKFFNDKLVVKDLEIKDIISQYAISINKVYDGLENIPLVNTTISTPKPTKITTSSTNSTNAKTNSTATITNKNASTTHLMGYRGRDSDGKIIVLDTNSILMDVIDMVYFKKMEVGK